MKKLLLKLLLAISFTISPTLSFGQAWADMGSTWHFESYGGYTKLEKIADTVIQGRTCDYILRKSVWYNPSENRADSSLLGRTYTYFSDSTVFLWNEEHEKFQVLYKLNARINDSWTILSDSRTCQDSSVVQVDSVGYQIIDGQPLKYITVKTISGKWFFQGRILDKLGNTTYLLPQQMCISDVEEGIGLRCFTNNTLVYQKDLNGDCNSFSRNNIEELSSFVKIYPTPASNQIRVSTSSNNINKEIDIYNVQGQFIQNYQILGKEILIDISNYSTGVYFIVLPNGMRSKFVKM